MHIWKGVWLTARQDEKRQTHFDFPAVPCRRSFVTRFPRECMQIDVVSERRLYAPWTGVAPSDEARARLDYVTASSGIIPVKRVLNQLHQFLGENGYNEVRYHLQSARPRFI